MVGETGGAKRARATIRAIVEEEQDFTIHVRMLREKSWGRRRGQWIAWVEQCGEDEYGMLAKGESASSAVRRLMSDLHRVLHVCNTDPEKIKTAYHDPGWAWAKEETS